MTWQASRFAHAQAVIAMLWLFLGTLKREQATKAFQAMADFRLTKMK